MQARCLGGTGIAVSQIGFGAWGIGGATAGATSYGATDDDVSRAALERAFELGITFFDTSSVYGHGHSERLIGEVFRSRRDRVVIGTKAGYARWDAHPDFSPQAVRRSLEGSLERLGTGYIDLLQLHNPPPAALDDAMGLLDSLDGLCREGVIRTYGVSFKAPSEALDLLRRRPVPVIQVNLNLLDIRAAEDGVLALAGRLGTGVIARTPLCFGFLSGTIDESTTFAADDHRARWSRAQICRWIEGSRSLLDLAGGAAAPIETALRFCLSFPEVSCVIPGILTPREAEENAAIGDTAPLSPETVARVLELHRRESFFVARS